MRDDLRNAVMHLLERIEAERDSGLMNACIDLVHAEVIAEHLKPLMNTYIIELAAKEPQS